MIHKFVEYIPPKEELEYDVIYIAIEYGTVIHKCACGCEQEVATPLSPTGWKLTYNGEAISLDPSIGNWGFNCKSHYWIKNNKVIWAPKWTQEEIDKGRAIDKLSKKKFYESQKHEDSPKKSIKNNSQDSIWKKIKTFFKKLLN